MSARLCTEEEVAWVVPEGRDVIGTVWENAAREHWLIALNDGSIFRVCAETGKGQLITKPKVH